MFRYLILVLASLFLGKNAYASIDISIANPATQTLVVSYQANSNYNIAPFNIWNSQVFTLRWSTALGDNIIMNIQNESAFQFDFDGVAVDGGDGFYYQKFTAAATNVSQNIENGSTLQVLTISLFNTDACSGSFELVPDIPFISSIFGTASVNNVLGEQFNDFSTSLVDKVLLNPSASFETWYEDADGDGKGNPAVQLEDCEQPQGFVLDNTDCDDTDPGLPTVQGTACDDGNTQTINDAIQVDGCTCEGTFVDCPALGLNFGAPCDDNDPTTINDVINTNCQCEGTPTACTGIGDADGDGACTDVDCADNDPSIYPGAVELCNGIDDDCDGIIPPDEIDNDFDGIVECQGDCDDTNAGVYPGATELCDNLDNDCNGLIDDNAIGGPIWHADADGDGFGDVDNSLQSCQQPSGFVADASDCDDSNENINPSTPEICNGIDDDCNGEIDEFATDAPTWYEDADGDGYGNQNSILFQCAQPLGYVSNLDDCDDGNATINPNTTWYADADADGFGDANASLVACDPGVGYVLDNTDCDDNLADVNPSGTETCNELDDDCDGQTDEGVQFTFFTDADNDGFGDPNTSILACTAPSGYVSNNDDCDDGDPENYPVNTEVCDGQDNDCDNLADDADSDVSGQPTWFADSDGDGFGDPNISLISCNQPFGYVADNMDLCPLDPNKTAPGICGCGTVDTDTDGDATADCNDGCPLDPAKTEPGICGCGAADEDLDGDGFYACVDDCDDNDASVYPGATEICGNNVDDDCDGQTDESALSISIVQSVLPTFCQGLATLTANASNSTPPLSYVWSGGLGSSPTETVFNNGTYTVSVTDGNGCQASVSQAVNVTAHQVLSSFVMIAEDKVETKRSIVNDGGIGVLNGSGEAKFDDQSVVNSFVKADEVEVTGGSTAALVIESPAGITLPTFRENTFNDNNHVTVPANQTMTLTGNHYGNIEVKENAILYFDNPEIFVKQIKTKQGAMIDFLQPAEVMVKGKMEIDKENDFNPSGEAVVIYLQDKLEVKENSNLTGVVYTQKNIETKGQSANQPTNMTGMFISLEEIKSDKWTNWNWSQECFFSPPPSNLLFFGANSTAEMDVQLEWINKSQTANDYFVVEKSADGVHFDSLLRQEGSGLGGKVEIYRDIDLNPFEGYNYYRLKLVYKDGSFEYSNIEVVMFNPDSDFTIFPNPTSDEVRLYLDRFIGKEEVDVIIVNMLGEVLYKAHLPEVKDKILPIRLDRNLFTDGLYSVSVVYLGRAQSKRLMVARN